MQNKPAVMIMGAGAMGLISGYHLSLAGADVTFLVRPGRFAELQSPQRLYCYNDGKLKEYTQYRAISSLEGFDCAAQDFILVTLDGAVSRTPEASATLRAIGAAIRNSTTTLIFGGVGVGLREHYLDTTGLPSERVLNGVLGLLSYQVARAEMPIIPPTQPELISKAYMAYVQFPNQVGFALEGSNAAAAKSFAEIYNRCSVSKCSVANKKMLDIMGNLPFAMFAVSELAGWPGLETLAKNKELWSLNCKAQAEVLGLSRFGWMGKLMRLVMTEKMHLKLWKKVEKDSLPMDFQAFNRFHHGGKVQPQDIEIMQNCVAIGEREGKAMSALKEVLARLEAHKHARKKATA